MSNTLPSNSGGPLGLLRIDHLGIAVRSIESALPFYQSGLALKSSPCEEVSSDRVRVCFLAVGESRLELLEPIDDNSPVARFLDKRGEGLHHVAFACRDITATLALLKSEGHRLIDETPRPGAHGMRVAFIHPKSAHGVLYELIEHADS